MTNKKSGTIQIFVGAMALNFMLLLCGVAAAGDGAGPDSSQDEREPMLRRSMQHDEIAREYFVHLPQVATVDKGELPVVIALHGYTSTATGFQVSHDLNRHADAHGYIVVYAQGSHFEAADEQGRKFLVTSWNDLAANQPPTPTGPHCGADSLKYPCPAECGECNRCAWTSCYDDVGFVAKVLDAVLTEFPADEERLYLLGVSNGAMMTLQLGCSLSERFAAVAPIIGQLAPGYACAPDVDLPMLHLFGGQDETVRFDGRPGTADGFVYTSAAQTATIWADAMSCQSGPNVWRNDTADAAGLVCTAYSGCSIDGHEVVSCMDPDGTHEWPEQSSGAPDATCITSEQFESLPDQHHCQAPSGVSTHLGMDLVWDFFRRYPGS